MYSHSVDATDEQGLPHPKVKYDEDKFQITLDCAHYRPEELDVKVEGNTIIITAKQARRMRRDSIGYVELSCIRIHLKVLTLNAKLQDL